jgi:hypothetical protein
MGYGMDNVCSNAFCRALYDFSTTTRNVTRMKRATQNYSIRNMKYNIRFGIESIVIDDITSVPNFMKIYQAVQTLSVGGTQIDRLVI